MKKDRKTEFRSQKIRERKVKLVDINYIYETFQGGRVILLDNKFKVIDVFDDENFWEEYVKDVWIKKNGCRTNYAIGVDNIDIEEDMEKMREPVGKVLLDLEDKKELTKKDQEEIKRVFVDEVRGGVCSKIVVYEVTNRPLWEAIGAKHGIYSVNEGVKRK